jgi:hypothetical protein
VHGETGLAAVLTSVIPASELALGFLLQQSSVNEILKELFNFGDQSFRIGMCYKFIDEEFLIHDAR